MHISFIAMMLTSLAVVVSGAYAAWKIEEPNRALFSGLFAFVSAFTILICFLAFFYYAATQRPNEQINYIWNNQPSRINSWNFVHNSYFQKLVIVNSPIFKL